MKIRLSYFVTFFDSEPFVVPIVGQEVTCRQTEGCLRNLHGMKISCSTLLFEETKEASWKVHLHTALEHSLSTLQHLHRFQTCKISETRGTAVTLTKGSGDTPPSYPVSCIFSVTRRCGSCQITVLRVYKCHKESWQALNPLLTKENT